MNDYIFNLETTKIELHFEKSDYDALTDQQRRELKSAFLWSNKGKCWVSRAKEPNLWRAKQVAQKLGFTKEQREGERLTYREQLEQQTERAEARANRYEGYAGNAAVRGQQLQKPLDSMRGDISFFTQPNINSSAGRAFTNYRNRLYTRYEKGFEEYRKSEYFNERAQTARETAIQKVEQLSVTQQMLIAMPEVTQRLELTEWNGRYNAETGEILKILYKALELYGFTFNSDSEELELLNGTHKLFAKSNEIVNNH